MKANTNETDLDKVQRILREEIHMELNTLQSELNHATADFNSENDCIATALLVMHKTRRLSSYVKDHRVLDAAQVIINRRLGKGY